MENLIDKTEIQRDADAIWPKQIQKLGLEPSNYDPATVKIRPIAGSSRIVILLNGNGVDNLIFKAQIPLGCPDAFKTEIDGHKRAYQALENCKQLHIPNILVADAESQSQIMEYAPGSTAHELFDLAEIGLGDRHQILTRCGAWISTFHKNTFVRLNPINPNVMLESMAWHESAVMTREVDVPQRKLFLECAAKIPDIAQSARGQKTRISATHGDMHLRNLILDGDDVYGIDFSAMRQVPTAHDLARFLVRYGSYFYADLDKNSDEPFNPGDLDAFYRGYGEEHRDDPALKYLLPIELLKEWHLIPKDKADRTATAQKRLHGITRMAAIMFRDF